MLYRTNPTNPVPHHGHVIQLVSGRNSCLGGGGDDKEVRNDVREAITVQPVWP